MEDDVGYALDLALAVALFVKFLGYALIAKLFMKAFPETQGSAFVVALVRTVMGAACGYVYCRVWSSFVTVECGLTMTFMAFYLGMFLFRIAQWWVVLRLFYEGTDTARVGACAGVGALWSHFLDVPAILMYGWTLGKLLPTLLPPFSF